MLLAVDVGNTSINNGIFKGKVLKREFRVSTHTRTLRAQYAKTLKPYLKKIERIILVSVVPEVLRQVGKLLKDSVHEKILVVGRDVESGVRNLYKKPGQVGQDRLVNARAAYELYGGAAIIVDFGTAITIDVVNENKQYLGGVIAPGIEVSLTALSERAALLPEIALERPRGILGKDTRQSMISGAVYGFSSLCDGIVRRLKKRYGRDKSVIATGGLSRLVGPYCESIDRIDPELTLKGLELIGADKNV